uniref:BPI fold-containing family B member 6-like isoform X2 n=1 Tax=Geotrypetes seraphini TaxID=260995 RepID=A0A6P8N4T1_GEOSA|nr:BPI fold-containing family B member 6-like isoform X2 [Geotrypetes seraphini]XP_033770451.1 BPI fold-containing family B member 6-like isoform X2 [Geotrypetes seraphini]XP_033770452.1 BPI fold-containing family B member 6-like isoform X2 [Geotrypetes seraphini]XP_033770453.1 BPI fold-containing family B member 6-like isoform X2 [Geotrypetes seraphini]XP_033770454.1 BPI fold-containing family B member 6-like isoform X2 [Geotrypetes seraphini]
MMLTFWGAVLLFALLDSSQCLHSAAILRLNSCTLKKSVKDSLLSIDFSKAMAKPPPPAKKHGHQKGDPAKGMSQMKLLNLEFVEISLKLVPDVGTNMTVTTKIEVGGKSILGGNMDIKMEVNIITATRLTQGENNCPKFVCEACQTQLLKVKANVPSGVLPGVINKFLDKTLHKLLPTMLCPTVETVLKSVNEKLCTADAKYPLGSHGFIDYSISELPEVTHHFIEIHINAMVEQMEDAIHSSANSSAPMTITSKEDATMLGVSADLLNSAFAKLQEEGLFNVDITEQTLSTLGMPPSISSLSAMMPQLPSLSQSFVLKIAMKDDAKVALYLDNALLTLNGAIELWDSTATDDLQPIFVLNADIDLKCGFAIAEGKLKSMVTLDKTSLSMVSSADDSLEVSLVDEFVRTMLNDVFVPVVNEELETAISLPDMLNINFSNAKMEILENLLLFSVNTCSA